MPEPIDQQPADDTGASAPDAPQPLADNLDVEELLAMGAGQPDQRTISMVVPPPADDDAAGGGASDDDDDEDDDAEDGDAADPEGDKGKDAADGESSPAPTDQPTPEAIQAAGLMLAESPQRINEIPRKQRSAAIHEAMRLSYTRGVSDMFAHVNAQSTQEQELRTFFDERNGARQQDPEEFSTWEDEHPEDAERFAQARRYFKAKADGKPVPLPGSQTRVGGAPDAGGGKPQLTESQQTIQNLANREADRLSALPQEKRDAIASQGFALTEDGLAAFRTAIDAAEAELRSSKAPEAARRRQESAQQRAGTARVDTGARGNAGPPKQNPIAEINDPDALFDMALEGASRRARG